MEHVRVAVYSTIGNDFEEVANKAKQGMLPIYRSQPGFVSYGLAQTSDTSFISLSIWQSREEADAAVALAEDWVRDNIATLVKLEDNYVGDFGFNVRA
jgi:heme-degrading monooxygenase HmoA